MNALVNILFILTPLLLPVLVYLERKVTDATFTQDQNTVEKQYKLLQLVVDLIKLFTDGTVWMIITFVIVTKGKGEWDYASLAVIMFIFCACIPYYCIKLKNSVLKNVVSYLILLTLPALSRILAAFFITVIINYFYSLGLYASGI